MKKCTNICFRTTDELRRSIENIARADRRTISGLVQAILQDYVEQRGHVVGLPERRTQRRKDVGLPVVVSQPGLEGATQYGVVRDVSVGGMRISLPEDSNVEVWRDGEGVHLDLVMMLPHEKVPATITCKPCRVDHEDGTIEVGAVITNCDSEDFRKLNRYLEEEDEN